MPFFLILVGLAAAVAFYVFNTYNWFVKTKTRIGASLQEIGKGSLEASIS